jgi:hypothetical protein
MDVRGTFSYGTWNTKLYDAAYNSGNFGFFGGEKKSNMFVDWHRMTSDGYQSFNYNMRNGGSLLYQYTFSPKTVLTGFSGVLRLNSNGPNIASTNCMLYGVTAAYACANANTANGLQPYTGAGIKFLLTNNSDPASWFDYQYNRYQVPTDFEYASLKSELGKGWYFEVKPYTYNYDNGELYSNATAIVDSTNSAVTKVGSSYEYNGSKYYLGSTISPCDIGVTKKGITALPCGIDKYNSYRKYGETSVVTQTSGLGVFRGGFWYEWADTNRHQYPSDPASNWADQPLPKFNESFWTNSYQPFVEYEFHVTPKLNMTPGGKLAYYSFDVLHSTTPTTAQQWANSPAQAPLQLAPPPWRIRARSWPCCPRSTSTTVLLQTGRSTRRWLPAAWSPQAQPTITCIHPHPAPAPFQRWPRLPSSRRTPPTSLDQFTKARKSHLMRTHITSASRVASRPQSTTRLEMQTSATPSTTCSPVQSPRVWNSNRPSSWLRG